MKIFVDTNILVDFLLEREPFFAAAARLVDAVERGEFIAYVSAISFNNVHYLARKSVGHAAALDMLRQMRRLFRVVPLDELVLDQAVAISVRDFEDAIQAVSAGRAQTGYIVTRNGRDFEDTKLDPYTAEEMLAFLHSSDD